MSNFLETCLKGSQANIKLHWCKVKPKILVSLQMGEKLRLKG